MGGGVDYCVGDVGIEDDGVVEVGEEGVVGGLDELVYWVYGYGLGFDDEEVGWGWGGG